VHEKADFAMAEKVVLNAKVQRPGVCNAIETLLVDHAIADKFVPQITAALVKAGVEIRGDAAVRQLVSGDKIIAATEDDWTTEYLDLILATRVVDGLDGALDHLAKYSSHHSDSIITEDAAAAERYLNEVDSATVYWNASTRFTDGAEFGFGAEIGISTDKLHARGPMGLDELTSYKYVIRGQGQIRT
jgi:glutamate-5-semialdehyde dehydrogenase